MSFLTPLYLAGLAALTLPIVMHFIRRRPAEHVEFSSHLFLKPFPPNVAQDRKIDHWLLLLLRLAALALLCFVFARPYFASGSPLPPQTEARRVSVLLLDRSASMRREDLWEQARQQAAEFLEATGPEDAVAMHLFDTRQEIVLDFETWSQTPAPRRVALAASRLAVAETSWHATDLGAALTLAAETLLAVTEPDDVEQVQLQREIVVISDFQQGSDSEALQGYDWPTEMVVRPYFVRPASPGNASLQWLRRSERAGGSAARVRPLVRISNTLDAEQEDFELAWRDVGVSTEEDSATETTSVDRPIRVHVPAGERRVMFGPPFPEGQKSVCLELRQDPHGFDNALYRVTTGKPLSVLFVGDGQADDPQALPYYLRQVLEGDAVREVSFEVFAPADGPPENSTAEVLVASGNLSDAWRVHLQTALRRGKSVWFILSSTGDVTALAGVLDVPALPCEEREAEQGTLLSVLDFTHPLFVPFASPQLADFTKIRFWQYRRLDVSSWPEAQVLAVFDDDSPALLEMPAGAGTLLVLTSGWHPRDSQLARSSKFVPLVWETLEYRTRPQLAEGGYEVGESIPRAALAAALRDEKASLAIELPDGSRQEVASDAGAFVGTTLPGIYTVFEGDQAVTRFAVHTAARESNTTPMELSDLRRWGLLPSDADRPEKENGSDASMSPIQEDAVAIESRQKSWQWLCLAALIVLTGETWLAGWQSRRATSPAELEG